MVIKNGRGKSSTKTQRIHMSLDDWLRKFAQKNNIGLTDASFEAFKILEGLERRGVKKIKILEELKF